MEPVTTNDRVIESAQGLLTISKIKQEDQGKYMCRANNTVGEDTIYVQIIVTGEFIVINGIHSKYNNDKMRKNRIGESDSASKMMGATFL